MKSTKKQRNFLITFWKKIMTNIFGGNSPLSGVLDSIRSGMGTQNKESESQRNLQQSQTSIQIPEIMDPSSDGYRSVFLVNSDPDDITYNTWRKTKHTIRKGTKYYVEFMDGIEIPVSEIQKNYRTIEPYEVKNYESYEDFYYKKMSPPVNKSQLLQGLSSEEINEESKYLSEVKPESKPVFPKNTLLKEDEQPQPRKNEVQEPVLNINSALVTLLDKSKKIQETVPIDYIELDNTVSKDLIRVLMETMEDINPEDFVLYIMNKNKDKIQEDIKNALMAYYFSN